MARNQRKEGQPRRQGNDSRSGSRGSGRPRGYTVEVGDRSEIRAELVGEEARDEAERCNGVTTTQLRRFFGAAKAEHRVIESDNQAKVAITLLNAKAHYAAARDKNMNKALSDFFNHHAKLITDKNKFGYFMKHFEAVLAYHKYNSEMKYRGRNR